MKTIARILDRAGEPRVRKQRRRLTVVRREHRHLTAARPNDVWTVDFKGWWRTRDYRRFEPLTVRDAFSRYVLALVMLPSTRAVEVKTEFERLFQARGLPGVVRVDNGAPFACTTAPGGLSRLSAWWISLGIEVSFSRPAHPEDNGGHERMHADIAVEIEAEPSESLEIQQRAADRWREEFNGIRPHEALGMKTPAEIYRGSSRRYIGVLPTRYPASYAVRRVTRNGCVHFAGKTVFVSESLVGHDVAVRRSNAGRMAVRFYDLDLGLFDLTAAPTHRPTALFPKRAVITRGR